MKFFLLAHVATLVVLVAWACDSEQLQNNLNALNVKLTSASASGARLSPTESISLCRELLARDGIFLNCLHIAKGGISNLFKTVRKMLQGYCSTECNDFLNLRDCINGVDGTDNNGTANCNHHFKIVRECVDKVEWCELRDPLFLSALPSSFRESLYDTGCVPRPECPPSYEQTSWCAGILQNVTGPLSQMCRYYEAAIKCMRCPQAHAMLLQVLGWKPAPVWLDICKSDCPDLLLALLSLEFCADKYNWAAASNNTCQQVWDITSCLSNRQVDLQCNDISHVLERVIPGLTSAQAQCASTTPQTTSSSPTTIMSTTTMTSTTTTMSTAATTTTTSPMTTPSTTSITTTPTTTSTTTTSIGRTSSDLMLLRKVVLQRCPPDNLTTHQHQEGSSHQDPDTSSHSLLMDVSSCLHLLEFEECLSKLPACMGSDHYNHCNASLPQHLQTLVSKREMCLQLVNRAAADMEIIKTFKYLESGQHSGGHKGFTNFTCKGAGAWRSADGLLILVVLVCVWLVTSG